MGSEHPSFAPDGFHPPLALLPLSALSSAQEALKSQPEWRTDLYPRNLTDVPVTDFLGSVVRVVPVARPYPLPDTAAGVPHDSEDCRADSDEGGQGGEGDIPWGAAGDSTGLLVKGLDQEGLCKWGSGKGRGMGLAAPAEWLALAATAQGRVSAAATHSIQCGCVPTDPAGRREADLGCAFGRLAPSVSDSGAGSPEAPTGWTSKGAWVDPGAVVSYPGEQISSFFIRPRAPGPTT